MSQTHTALYDDQKPMHYQNSNLDSRPIRNSTPLLGRPGGGEKGRKGVGEGGGLVSISDKSWRELR